MRYSLQIHALTHSLWFDNTAAEESIVGSQEHIRMYHKDNKWSVDIYFHSTTTIDRLETQL